MSFRLAQDLLITLSELSEGTQVLEAPSRLDLVFVLTLAG